MVRSARRVSVLLAVLLSIAIPASAQVVQSFHVMTGGFFPRGIDSRDANDVLSRNFVGEFMPGDPTVTDALAFEIKDFRTGHLFGEWNVAFGDHIEVGAGLGFYRRSVPTLYLDVVDENRLDIEQTLKLRVVPFTALVRFLPFGNAQTFGSATARSASSSIQTRSRSSATSPTPMSRPAPRPEH
jgi:hypothetical protein